MLSAFFSPTGGFAVSRRLRDGDERELVAGLRQYIEDGRSQIDGHWRPAAVDDYALDAGRTSRAWSGRHQHDPVKKRRQHVDERRRYDFNDFGSQHNILDPIGSNIIRRK